jgi:hypothetical protein
MLAWMVTCFGGRPAASTTRPVMRPDGANA